jgi:type I restriction enzyme M protein
MLRIGSMNLMLHGIEAPKFFYMDTLSKEFNETAAYDVILMNPPFKGAVDANDVNPTLPTNTTKSELLFLHLILRALDMGGRCAVIVPDGVLFGSSNAHKAIRKKLLDENRLDGVVSMPGGVFKPYAGVSTAILLFTKGATTADEIWFYDMAHDGFTLDDKRIPITDNDLPDILACWRNRHDATFAAARQARLAALRTQVEPLKAQRLQMQAEINRLTFARVIAPAGEEDAAAALAADQTKLDSLQTEIAPLQTEINQLSRQFWVKKKEIQTNGYDLSASRYRQVEQDEAYYEQPQVTMTRLLQLEQVMGAEVRELQGLML